MSEDNDWDELTCPLIAVRGSWDEDGADVFTRRLERCGEALFLREVAHGTLHTSGSCDSWSSWRVECLVGHVVLVPDEEGNESGIKYDHAELTAVLGLVPS